MRPPFLAALAVVVFLALSLPKLAGPPLLPEEAALVLDSSWLGRLDLAQPWLEPESSLRLPGLVVLAGAVGGLVFCYAGAGLGTSGLLLVAFSPALVTAARTAGALPWAASINCMAAAMFLSSDRRHRRLGVLSLAAAVALLVGRLAGDTLFGGKLFPGGILSSGNTLLARDTLLAFALGSWGVVAGPTLPPWRLDVVIIVYLCALGLGCCGAMVAAKGAGRNAIVGLALFLGLLGLAGAVGVVGPRVDAAATAGGVLSPVLGVWVARGIRRLPSRFPRAPLVGVVLSGSLIGILNLYGSVDQLDAARRVRWDEVARVIAVLETAQLADPADVADVQAGPDVPAALRYYAPCARFNDSGRWQSQRVLVISHGLHGGLRGPSVDLEAEVERRGYRLKGELLEGEIEPGLAALSRRLTGIPPPLAYLRVRRYERR